MAILNANGSAGGTVDPEQAASIEEARRKLGAAYGGSVAAGMQSGGQAIALHDNKLGEVDTNNYVYGSSPEQAAQDAARYRGIAEQAQGRQGEQINTFHSEGDRTSALNMASLMEQRARGTTPSIAGMQADRQMGLAAAEQSSAAAGARGPAALALAQQGAAANTAAMQSNISGQAQINAANERMQAEQNAFNAFGSVRGQDMQGAQAQAQMNAAQRAQNDQYSTNMYGNEIGVNSTQLAANMNKQAQMNGNALNMESIITDREAGQNAKEGAVLQAGGSAVGSIATMGSGGKKGSTGSDETTKVPITWGTATTPAPNPNDAPATWGTGPGTSEVDAHAAQARRALDENDARTAAYGPGPVGRFGVGDASGGMASVRAREEEDLARLEAYDRNGIKPSKKDSIMRAVLEHRLRGKEVPAAKDDSETAEDEHKRKVSSAVAGLGGLAVAGAAMSLGSRGRTLPASRMVQPQMIPLPGRGTYSDETTKEKAENVGASLNELAKYPPAPMGGFGPMEAAKTIHGAGQAASAAGEGYERLAEKARPTVDAVRKKVDGGIDEAVRRGGNAAAALRGADPVDGPRREPVSMQRGASTVDTALTPAEEKAFTSWKARYAPKDSGADYDLRGAFKAGIKPDPKTGHWPDTFKKPNHETFSDESQYAKQGKPGHWDGETFTPAHDAMADANRSMAAQPYAYKPEYAAREGQAPGEVNVGPMAQNMAKSPAAATAVKTDPQTGKLVLDDSKFTKVIAGGVSSLQNQVDQQEKKISFLVARLRGKKRSMDEPEQRGRLDEESLGPSGDGNRDYPDYNFQKTGSPLDIATALETNPNAISPSTEAHMRREGLWTAKTDELLRARGLRGRK